MNSRNHYAIQPHVEELANQAGLGPLLMITGRDATTRSYTYSRGTIVVPLASNAHRYEQLRALYEGGPAPQQPSATQS